MKETIFEGYRDEENKMMEEAIEEFREKRGLEKGELYELNKEKGMKVIDKLTELSKEISYALYHTPCTIHFNIITNRITDAL